MPYRNKGRPSLSHGLDKEVETHILAIIRTLRHRLIRQLSTDLPDCAQNRRRAASRVRKDTPHHIFRIRYNQKIKFESESKTEEIARRQHWAGLRSNSKRLSWRWWGVRLGKRGLWGIGRGQGWSGSCKIFPNCWSGRGWILNNVRNPMAWTGVLSVPGRHQSNNHQLLGKATNHLPLKPLRSLLGPKDVKMQVNQYLNEGRRIIP